ncbi:hypothetical protein HK103_000015 [Boothiomyces macroporosus]|uniref:Uncharacterized protein n=1 Tax=Boothiomyces macroporosus TaxID=261099 RepID=A0AAD5URR0_9FUNG|nr:hypothetical protein HK103_000015 [Boothiomyces macroporosus]
MSSEENLKELLLARSEEVQINDMINQFKKKIAVETQLNISALAMSRAHTDPSKFFKSLIVSLKINDTPPQNYQKLLESETECNAVIEEYEYKMEEQKELKKYAESHLQQQPNNDKIIHDIQVADRRIELFSKELIKALGYYREVGVALCDCFVEGMIKFIEVYSGKLITDFGYTDLRIETEQSEDYESLKKRSNRNSTTNNSFSSTSEALNRDDRNSVVSQGRPSNSPVPAAGQFQNAKRNSGESQRSGSYPQPAQSLVQTQQKQNSFYGGQPLNQTNGKPNPYQQFQQPPNQTKPPNQQPPPQNQQPQPQIQSPTDSQNQFVQARPSVGIQRDATGKQLNQRLDSVNSSVLSGPPKMTRNSIMSVPGLSNLSTISSPTLPQVPHGLFKMDIEEVRAVNPGISSEEYEALVRENARLNEKCTLLQKEMLDKGVDNLYFTVADQLSSAKIHIGELEKENAKLLQLDSRQSQDHWRLNWIEKLQTRLVYLEKLHGEKDKPEVLMLQAMVASLNSKLPEDSLADVTAGEMLKMRQEINLKDEEIQKLEAKLATDTPNTPVINNELQGKVDILEAEKKELISLNEGLNDKVASLTSTLAALKKEHSELKDIPIPEAPKQDQTELRNLQLKLSSTSSELEKLKQWHQKALELMDNNSKLQAEKNEVDSMVFKFKAQLKNSTRKLTEQTQQLEVLQKEKSELEAEVKKLQEQLNQKSNISSADDLFKVNEALSVKVAEYEVRIESLNNMYKMECARAESLKKTLDELVE